MLIGAALAQWLARTSTVTSWLATSVPRGLRWLPVLGRWSLLYYLLHQPVLIGALQVWQ
jgi:uncharacterized membrane protein